MKKMGQQLTACQHSTSAPVFDPSARQRHRKKYKRCHNALICIVKCMQGLIWPFLHHHMCAGGCADELSGNRAQLQGSARSAGAVH